MKDNREILARYKRRLDNAFEERYEPQEEPTRENQLKATASAEYEYFVSENIPETASWYEKACAQSEKILRMQPGKKKDEDLRKAIEEAHLNVTPAGVVSFSYLLPLAVIILFGLTSYIFLQSMFMLVFFVFAGLIMITPLSAIPFNAATKSKMAASNQMILGVFYMVTFMRHTSNIEQAVKFAADQLAPPLSLDFKKIIWNVETEKYSTIKESFDEYLERWRGTNDAFIESVHLIESSLFEGYEERRLELLDKSLDVILDGTFERMLHYAQDLKAPINNLNMLGVILPILGLVILPLVVSFMESVRWYHISALYNIALPLGVYFMGQAILTNRPSGYGGAEIGGDRGRKKDIRFMGIRFNASPLFLATAIGMILILIGFSPVLIHIVNPNFDISMTLDGFSIKSFSFTNEQYATIKLIDYQPFEATPDPDDLLGPFGFGASLLSVFVPLGLGIGIGSYFKFKSGDVMKIREESRKLEEEFSSALFQLGNRLGDGFPAELAFGRVADVMRDTVAGKFFSIVSNNISKLGLGVHDAIFHERIGAMSQFPSSIISSSMKVLTQSIKKGPKIAAQAMANVARYIKEIHKVNERLKDLMSEIIVSMRSQVTFLSPAISGIVVGITAMITSILGRLSLQMRAMDSTAGAGGNSSLIDMFGQGIPTFYFQIIVGIYVVQLAYILTIISSGIENGEDPVGRDYMLGKMVIKSTTLYCALALVIMCAFSLIASFILAEAAGAP